ncbi:hypothetical protein [Synechococcus phage Yong-L2-223]|nr:hypothetical protein [Synechococcus phage Yong-L2-223]
MGEPNWPLVAALRGLHTAGFVLCTWSCRADSVVEKWLDEHNISDIFTFINDSPHPSDSGKRHFDLIVDDTAFRWRNDVDVIGDLLDAANSIPDGPRNLGERDVDFSDRNPKVWYQGTGRMFQDHFERKWKNAWEAKKAIYNHRPVAFMTICSHAKPYSKSHIHASLRKALYDWGLLDTLDYIHISGAGITPSEAEMVYPFNAYDGDYMEATENAKAYLREVLERRLKEWLAEYSEPYEKIVVYLKPTGNTASAVEALIRDTQDPRITFVKAQGGLKYRLPYALTHDPDDCLLHEKNLRALWEVFW